MTFLERFKGKLSQLTKLGLINNLDMPSSPIEKITSAHLPKSTSKYIK